jgi:hypothetical protein
VTARKLSSLAASFAFAFAFVAAAGAATPGPNGRIVFSSSRAGSNPQLYSAAPDGSDVKRLSWTDVAEQHGAWSPDGTRIAYERGNGPFQIWLMNADGSGQTQLTPASGSGDIEPAWSPDGARVAFASARSGAWHIWVVNADGSGLHQLTTGTDQTTYPAWSPDGSRLAYASASGGGLFVADADGSDPRPLTTPSAGWYDEHPDWSPDGSTIVFSRRDFGATVTGLYTISAAGTNERQLAPTPPHTFNPAYSPDGTKVVFQADSSLYEIDAGGGGLIALPAGPAIGPAWGSSLASPDVTAPEAPHIQILSPPDGALLWPGQQVPAWYTCDSFVSIVVSCVGTVPLGAWLDTSTSGTKLLTVTASDLEGRQATATVSYTVLDLTPPKIDLRAPADGAVYDLGARVVVDYACSDEDGGSGLDVCAGQLPSGAPLDTSRPGSFTFRIDAFDRARNHSVAVATYRVVDRTPPTISITAPADGAAYALGSVVSPVYSCADAGSGIAWCRASGLDTSSLGQKIFGVAGADNAGNTASASVSYSVVYAFEGFYALAAIPSANDARAGDALHLRFSLGGDQGLEVVSAATWTPCGGGDPEAAKAAVSYKKDAYDLKAFTADAWAGTCRDLALTLADGTTHRVRFVFRR